MKTVSLFWAIFGAVTMAACSAGVDVTGNASDAVVLDVRCADDADCPGVFECEVEEENGIETSYCVSHDGGDNGDGSCPDGYELEEEHGSTFCKPHGGSGGQGANSGHGGGGGNGGGGSSGGNGGGGSGGDDGIGGSNGDCPPGYELEEEHGETFCQPHGGEDD